MIDPAIIEELVETLVRAEIDEPIEIPGIGSFALKRYSAYERRQLGTPTVVTHKRLPFFSPDVELRRMLAGQPPAIVETTGRAALAATILDRLSKHEPADIPGLGLFEAKEKNGRWFVQFTAAESLKARLNAAESLKARLDPG